MIKQYFTHPIDGRTIVIFIDKEDNGIEFMFKNGMTFYDIPLNEWNDHSPRWQDHLSHKNWFTESMKEFIDKSI